ncbi:LysR family transcriptional regulator [Thalassospiraceae bacterium LMO-SO8]|nr:LysR family transcriptional regulator [Alphaproteobacteria bacterium LMO-S08]WND76552.1 LysR family transcriptional regulator [Thalassospiraceae bacterium LMO-SO8]
MNFTLRQLQVLTAVARHGSFTRAAQDLGMTQSAVSTSVRHLEAELGLPLFERDTRNVRPTEAGRDLAARVGGLLNDLANALENARGTAERRRGRVRIAAVPTAVTRLLPPCCAECRGRYPEIDLRIEEMAAEDVAAAVLDGRADLGVLNEGRQDLAMLAATPLGNDVFCLICPQGHPLARKRAPTWRDLDGQDMVMLDARTGSRALIDAVLRNQGVSVRPVQEMSRPEAVAALVAAGMGIAVLPELAAPTAADRVLVTRRLSEPEAFRRMVLVHAPGRTLEGPAALVAEILARRGA